MEGCPLCAQKVTMWALKDVRELEAADSALQGAARCARCAAFACVATGIAATQHQEKWFDTPLKEGESGAGAIIAGPLLLYLHAGVAWHVDATAMHPRTLPGRVLIISFNVALC